MKASDTRRHSPEKLEVLRERRSAMRREGFRAVELAQALGVVRGTVYKWFRNAAACTKEQALTGGQRGRPKGLGAKLTKQQEARSSLGKNPKQLKFDFALWTRRAVQALIMREFQVELSMSAVGVYLRSWGLTVQRPAKRAIEQDDERVRKWKIEEYPAIAKRAKVENAIIFGGDESETIFECTKAKWLGNRLQSTRSALSCSFCRRTVRNLTMMSTLTVL